MTNEDQKMKRSLLRKVRKHFPSYDLVKFLKEVNHDSVLDCMSDKDHHMFGGLFIYDDHIKGFDFWWDATMQESSEGLEEHWFLLQDMYDLYRLIVEYYNNTTYPPAN